MTSIAVGPLALPVAPLLAVIAALFAAGLARRLARGDDPAFAERELWRAALVAALAARAAHVMRHADAYLATPGAIVDVRDGGWNGVAAVAAAVAWLGWRLRAAPVARRAVGTAVLAGLAAWIAANAALRMTGDARPGAPVPDVALEALDDGRRRSLRDAVAGGPAVVNVWATWCAPCRAEMPAFAAAQRAHADVRVVFVNAGEPADVVRAWLAREGLALDHVWLDRAAALGPAVGSRGLPTSLFVDGSGRVDVHFGVLNAAALHARVRLLRDTRPRGATTDGTTAP